MRIARREFLLGTVSSFVLGLSAQEAFSDTWATYSMYEVTSPGEIFELPNQAGIVGILDCAQIVQIANLYRSACNTLDEARLDEIRDRLTQLTQVEVLRLQKTIDLESPKETAEYIGILNGILTSVLGALVIATAIFATPVVAAGTAAVALIYGLGVAPTISIVKTSIVTNDASKILLTWAGGRGSAVALQSAEALAEAAGKTALKGLIAYAGAVLDVFGGIKEIMDGAATIENLRNTTDRAAAKALVLMQEFQPVLQDRNELRRLLCTVSTSSAEALERYASDNASTNCKHDFEIRHLRFGHDVEIIRG